MSLSLIVSLIACFVTGCSRGYKEYIDGYFQYIIVGENSDRPDKNNEAVVAIIDFSGLGSQQEVIDIPEEIGGKPVRYISYRDPTFFTTKYYELTSDHLKKIYIHENIKTVYDDAFWNFGDNLEVMVCAAKSPTEIFESLDGKFYIYQSVYESRGYKSHGENDVINRANIVFMNNYSDAINEGYYSLDHIQSGEKINPPKSPVRSGYTFIGWYTEPQCINVWDFNVSPTIEEGAEFRLYAAWRAL